MVERCELTLQSRLEPPTLTKDTSIDSTGTEDLTSASGGSNCTTQPMVHALIQPPPTVSAEAPLLLGTMYLCSSVAQCWNLMNFLFITQILREIYVWECRSAKSAI